MSFEGQNVAKIGQHRRWFVTGLAKTVELIHVYISNILDHTQINMLSNSLKPKDFIVAVGGVIISALITLLTLF